MEALISALQGHAAQGHPCRNAPVIFCFPGSENRRCGISMLHHLSSLHNRFICFRRKYFHLFAAGASLAFNNWNILSLIAHSRPQALSSAVAKSMPTATSYLVKKTVPLRKSVNKTTTRETPETAAPAKSRSASLWVPSSYHPVLFRFSLFS